MSRLFDEPSGPREFPVVRWTLGMGSRACAEAPPRCQVLAGLNEDRLTFILGASTVKPTKAIAIQIALYEDRFLLQWTNPFADARTMDESWGIPQEIPISPKVIQLKDTLAIYHTIEDVTTPLRTPGRKVQPLAIQFGLSELSVWHCGDNELMKLRPCQPETAGQPPEWVASFWDPGQTVAHTAVRIPVTHYTPPEVRRHEIGELAS